MKLNILHGLSEIWNSSNYVFRAFKLFFRAFELQIPFGAFTELMLTERSLSTILGLFSWLSSFILEISIFRDLKFTHRDLYDTLNSILEL